jgi:hypothetical protein
MGRLARRSRRVTASSLAVVAMVAGAVLATAPESSAAASLTIGGYVFYDRDADGHRDPGSPASACTTSAARRSPPPTPTGTTC